MSTDAALVQLQNQIAELTVVVRDLAQRLPTLVTIEEAARVFSVSTRSVRRRIKSREWPAVHVGREIRVDLTAIRPGFGR